MPAMTYTLRWPDATLTVAYSPSLVILDYLVPGDSYALGDFITRLREATTIASDRVRAKYGFACSRAADQLQQLEALVQRFDHDPAARVDVVGFGPAD